MDVASDPLAKVEIADEEALIGTTDAEGLARVDTARGYILATRSDLLPKKELPPPAGEHVDMILERAIAFRGRVVDQNGKALPQVLVSIDMGGPDNRDSKATTDGVVASAVGVSTRPCFVRQTYTDSTGMFVVYGGNPAHSVIRLEKFGYAAVADTNAMSPSADDTQPLVMRRVFVLAVRIVNACKHARFHPLNDVSLLPEVPPELRGIHSPSVTEVKGAAAKAIDKIVGGDGVLTLIYLATPNVDEGSRYVVKAKVDQRFGKPFTANLGIVPLDRFTSSDLGMVRVNTECGGHGTVIAKSTVPLVAVRSPGMGEQWVRPASADGESSVFDLPLGKYRLQADQLGFVSTEGRSLDVEVADGSIENVDCSHFAKDLTRAIVRVRDAGGRPTSRYTLRVTQGGHLQLTLGAILGPEVTFYLLPGAYKVDLLDSAARDVRSQTLTIAKDARAAEMTISF
jgi:hypothetical protein